MTDMEKDPKVRSGAYQQVYANPRIRYRARDIETLNLQLRKPIDDAHRARILIGIRQKEAEIEQIMSESTAQS